MFKILDESCEENEFPNKKRVKDFLLANLRRNCQEFESLEEIEIEEDSALNDKIHDMTKKCHDLANISLNILREDEGEILDDIENCAMGLSEIKNWIKASVKNKALDSEINDISNYFDGLEIMADRMEFMDSLESKSIESQKTLRAVMRKRLEENGNP